VRDDVDVIVAAELAGYRFSRSETDTGQQVWSWTRADGSGPSFLTRRAAIDAMVDLLARSRARH
jgi:hypothetical protein